MSPDEDFFASFRPVAPGPREHDWRLESPTRARCIRCDLVLVARLSQVQVGHAVAAELAVEATGERYRDARCRR